MLKAVAALPGVEAVVNQYKDAGAPQPSESAETTYARVLVDESAMIASAHRTRPASKIAVSEGAFGALCGLDGVEADGVAETVGVAGDAS